LVGLYETAIDHLSSWEIDGSAARPKVIAATATIRQADLQVRALFMRKVNIFPPQGLDVQDNFFSRQRPPSTEIPGRRYLGICAGGKRLKAAEIRVYLAYLAAAQVLYEKYGPPADPWMTLVGYFNSVRELGGMRHMLDDDIKNRIWRMAQRGLASRTLRKVEELTSRVGTSNIPDVLSMLEMPFGADQSNGARPTNGVKATKHKVNPIDVLLATNMISVGVDIKRLGLMVVTGQPKTTAEYIQATSRVGRSHPGMVCVIHHWARPRDLSHYEQFEQYHATFYQRVEALSVTPFAPRALDRGLAALLTSIVRLSGPQFNKNDAAGNLTPDNRYLTNAIATITTRAEEVDSEAAAYIGDDLQRLKDHWLREIEEKPRLGYETQRDGTTLGLLKEPQRGQWEPFTCLNSLRNVEPNVRLILDEHGSSQASSSLIEDVDTPEEGE
ncbi:MAG: helicase, partial [Ktedonobacteraceae bacterium]|nr:helicase [Ktedonobacteraceae bacterium]